MLCMSEKLWHCTQVELCADYEPGRLMSFLVASQAYGLEAAAELCEHRGLVREQVFVLGRMGSARQALHLIISRLADIPQVPAPSFLPGPCALCRGPCTTCGTLEPLQGAAHCPQGYAWAPGSRGAVQQPTCASSANVRCVHAMQAIEFVQMQRDDELWELLISLALSDAGMTGTPQTLLATANTCAWPCSSAWQ